MKEQTMNAENITAENTLSIGAASVAEDQDGQHDESAAVTPVRPLHELTLSEPIVRKDGTITRVEISAAAGQSGSLRGLSVADLASLKADPMKIWLSRVLSPSLSKQELDRMATGDFMALCVMATDFLAPTPFGDVKKAAMEA